MLHIIEAPDELAVRTLQGVVRIDMIKPSGIDDTEKEIAELIGGFLLVLLGQFCLQFAELFPHLVPYVLFLFPIEADIARLVLNAVSQNWEQIKLKEKDGNKSVLGGVPEALPSDRKSVV